MKIYVDEQKRYEDTKATGQCFTGVGAIGLIAIVLLDTGVIKLAALDSVNKLMVSIVMGLVFLIIFYHRNEVIYGAKGHFKKN